MIPSAARLGFFKPKVSLGRRIPGQNRMVLMTQVSTAYFPVGLMQHRDRIIARKIGKEKANDHGDYAPSVV